jgi:hypothetical protein
MAETMKMSIVKILLHKKENDNYRPISTADNRQQQDNNKKYQQRTEEATPNKADWLEQQGSYQRRYRNLTTW